MSEWINARYRLPDEDGFYLVICSKIEHGFATNKECAVMHFHPGRPGYTHKRFMCAGGIVITHWMPLPEPPEV